MHNLGDEQWVLPVDDVDIISIVAFTAAIQSICC